MKENKDSCRQKRNLGGNFKRGTLKSEETEKRERTIIPIDLHTSSREYNISYTYIERDS